jgi:hypothetical protein
MFGRSEIVDAWGRVTTLHEKREPAKRVGRGGGGALSRPQGPFMTCDLGRRVSRTPWWNASVSSYVVFAVTIRRTQAGALYP